MSVRLCCSLLALGLFLAMPRGAAADDDLSKFVEQNRILAQKIKSEAAQAMAEARLLEKADPVEAQALLQKALKQVQNATALSAAEQTQLTGQLLSRLRDVGELVRQAKVSGQQAPLKELPKKPSVEPPSDGPAAIAKKFIDNGNAGVNAGARVLEDKNKGFGAAVGGIVASSVPPSGDVTFPKDWAAKTKIRETFTKPQMSAKEVALIKALNSVMSVDFKEKSFKDVLDYMQDRTGQAIIVDPAALKDGETDYSTIVNFKANKVTVRFIMQAILKSNRLTYVLKEGAILVVTPEQAREMMVVRSYPISDIVAPSGFATQFGPFVARQQMLNNVQGVINLVQGAVDPTIWQANGGNGSITFHEPSMSLIIRAPAELHYQMAGGLFR